MSARPVGHGPLDAGLTGACNTLKSQVTGPVVFLGDAAGDPRTLRGVRRRRHAARRRRPPPPHGRSGPRGGRWPGRLVGRADRVDLGRRAAGLAGSFAADLRLAAAASPPPRLAGVGVARLPVARRPRRGRRLALRGRRRPGACRAPSRRPDGGSGAAGGGRPPVARPRTGGGARARRLPRPGEQARGATARGPRAPLRGRAADRPARAGRGGAGRGGDRPSLPRGAASPAGTGAVSERASGRGAPLDLERPIHVRRGARPRPRRRAATARVGGARSRSCPRPGARADVGTSDRSWAARARRQCQPSSVARPRSTCWQSALDDARQGHATVVIEGAAGIGKTRLVAEFAADARRSGVLVAWGSCYEGPAAPSWWPWLTIVQTIVNAMPATAGAELDQLLRPSSDANADVSPKRRFELHEAVREALTAATDDRPVAVILDDLQWADEASLELLEHLTRTLGDAPVLFIVMLRDLEIGRSDSVTNALAVMARRPASRRVRLLGLGDAEIATLLSDTAGTQLPDELAVGDQRPCRRQPVLRHRAGARRPGGWRPVARAPGQPDRAGQPRGRRATTARPAHNSRTRPAPHRRRDRPRRRQQPAAARFRPWRGCLRRPRAGVLAPVPRRGRGCPWVVPLHACPGA